MRNEPPGNQPHLSTKQLRLICELRPAIGLKLDAAAPESGGDPLMRHWLKPANLGCAIFVQCIRTKILPALPLNASQKRLD